MYIGMSWCRSFSNLPQEGRQRVGKKKIKKIKRQKDRRSGCLPCSTDKTFCILFLILHEDSALVAAFWIMVTSLSYGEEDKNILHYNWKMPRVQIQGLIAFTNLCWQALCRQESNGDFKYLQT